MKTRVIASAVLLPLLAIAVFLLPTLVTAILFAVLSALAAFELLRGTGLVRHNRLVIYSMVMAALVPIWSHYGQNYAVALLGIMVFFVAVFGEMMASHVKIPFEKVAYCIFAGLLLPFLFSSLIRIHVSYSGRYLIVIPFLLAFLSDSGAYFAGRFFGHHKLAAVISPKKTVEGAVGGALTAIIGMLLYALIMKLAFSFQANFGLAVLYGVIGSAAGVFGDLCFSVIKRQTGIKDYGNLIPGHGGVLDRFDSMMVIGPLTEALLILLPVVV